MADVAEMILEDYHTSLEDDVVPVLDDMVSECAPYVSPSRLYEVRRAIEILEDFKNHIADMVQLANV